MCLLMVTSKSASVSYRDFQLEDAEATLAMIRRAIQQIPDRDYDWPRRQAWASFSDQAWLAAVTPMTTLVAVTQDREIAGFAAMTATGYLDYLYVDPAHQGAGIGAHLLRAIERRQPASIWTTDASITAQPFFEHHGYQVIKENQVERQQLILINFRMQKIA